MARIVKFPVAAPDKLGPKKARKRRKPNLEDYGQLNLFDQEKGRVVSISQKGGYFDEALTKDEAGDPDAEQAYLLAIQHGDSVMDAYCNLGIMKSEQNQYSASINYLSKALELSPRHFEAHYNLANVYSEMGNLALSKAHYEVAIAIDPDFPNSYYNLGLVLISQKAYNQALDAVDEYIRRSFDEANPVAKELKKTLISLTS